jgi:peptidyl-prolyl cis-trans isomerase C
VALIKNLFKEPLVHFLLAGAALFIVFELVGRESPYAASRRIEVDGERLLTFQQFNSKTTAPEGTDAGLDALSSEEFERLIEDFVRQEALYREAKALGLDSNDPTFRRMLIGRLNSVNQMVISSGVQLSERDLEDYLAAHEDRYSIPPAVTFTHVFFSRDRHGDEAALALARAKLDELNTGRVPFHGAPSHGDRFLYHPNYVRKDAAEIASHFGDAMQRELFALDADDTRWIGPLRSPYGYHLVMVAATSAGYTPKLEEIRRRVEADAYQTRVEEELERIANSIVESYDIVVDKGLRARLDASGSTESQITN